MINNYPFKQLRISTYVSDLEYHKPDKPDRSRQSQQQQQQQI